MQHINNLTPSIGKENKLKPQMLPPRWELPVLISAPSLFWLLFRQTKSPYFNDRRRSPANQTKTSLIRERRTGFYFLLRFPFRVRAPSAAAGAGNSCGENQRWREGRKGGRKGAPKNALDKFRVPHQCPVGMPAGRPRPVASALKSPPPLLSKNS